MRLSTVVTCCALSFVAPFALGGEGLIEDRAWDTAQATGTMVSLERFVMHFPESRFVGEARDRIALVRGAETVGQWTYPQRVSYAQ